MEEQAVERLEAKSPEEAIIEQISKDFNLAPFMARTQFEQMRRYFEHYLGLERDVGQMTFLAISGDTPVLAENPIRSRTMVNNLVLW